MHLQFGVNPNNLENGPSLETTNRIMVQLRRVILLIIDERSMVSNQLLDAVERHSTQLVHGGGNSSLLFGGIPVILLFGDDMQIPPVFSNGQGLGAFHALSTENIPIHEGHKSKSEYRGRELFRKLSNNVMEITYRRRQDGDETTMKILDDLETGCPSEETVKFLLNLNIRRLSPSKMQHMKKNSIFIFATHNEKNEHNCMQLAQLCSEENPLLCLKYKNASHNSKSAIIRHFNTRLTPLATQFCVGCKVALKRNFQPQWGLYNGAIGTVQEIIYKQDCNPNFGHFPEYIAVDFPSFSPPDNVTPFDKEHPQVVPIPMAFQMCKYRCCKIIVCPLVVAFGRTIHSFQGQEAGPGKAIPSIIVSPGSKSFESNNIGTLNTCVSRVTTLGGKNSDSALYFTGPYITHDRFRDLTLKANGEKLKKIILRDKWVHYLSEQCRITREKFHDIDLHLVHNIFQNIDNMKISYPNLDDVVSQHLQQPGMK